MQAVKHGFAQIINGPKQFVIPVFQRDYAWGPEQCDRVPGRRTHRLVAVLSGAVQWKSSAAATAALTGPPRARFPNPVANTTS